VRVLVLKSNERTNVHLEELVEKTLLYYLQFVKSSGVPESLLTEFVIATIQSHVPLVKKILTENEFRYLDGNVILSVTASILRRLDMPGGGILINFF
jgi:hypothetical protein